jgi:hypothetical protein
MGTPEGNGSLESHGYGWGKHIKTDSNAWNGKVMAVFM